MSVTTFLLVSVIGRIPGTYLLTMQGATIRNQQYRTFAIFMAVTLVGLVIGYIYRNKIFAWIKHRHDHD
jgi:uncharacterized membrane protein YdjX (TVP38/TMEM64 family)